MHIIKQILKVAILNDYSYDRQLIVTDTQHVITMSDQYTDLLSAHFTTPDKPSQTIIEFNLTQHDYYNLQYIAQYAELLNMLVKKYSTLSIQYPVFSDEEISAIPKSFVLECSFDIAAKKVLIDETKFSPQQQFVLLYLQTIELIKIYIDIYNDFERKQTDEPLVPLDNGI